MSRKAPIHRPYSFKKEVLDAWKDAQKEEGMTKVKFSRMHRVTISTFDNWLAKADGIAKVENGSSKHVRGRSKRGAYSKERPSDEKKGQLYDWLKAAPKPVNQADLRKEARASGQNERYFPTATDQQAQQHVDQLTAQQDEQQVHQLTDQQIEQRVNQLNDQQAGQETDHQDEQHGDQLTDQQADIRAHQHVDQLTDQQAGQQIAALTSLGS
ncbi:hypothetical protein AC1031_007681 [Aphanomyces cochlioides]|nr:hypothetical protein AC1031_007681 [Aphanomyces cochlioides]